MRTQLTRPQAACWIAWHLPALPLESFLATLEPTLRAQPWVLCAGPRVQAVNEGAAALGVRSGQGRATALALAPALRIGVADDLRDAEARQAVAHVALSFTPMVVLWGAQTVLLEVASTLRLWGGWTRLRARLKQALAPLGHHIQWAAAPTALGAVWLAHADRSWPPGRPSGLTSAVIGCDDARESDDASAHITLPAMRRALDRLTLQTVPGFEAVLERAVAMGLYTLADLRALPRDGLARRFGTDLLQQIDRARGDVPDPQEPIRPPEVFEARLELFARADTVAQVQEGAAVLLERLRAWAGARQGRVERLTLTLRHEPRHRVDGHTPAATPLTLALAEPSNDPVHLHTLLRERLGRLSLPAPTLELTLRCAHLARGPVPHGELFPTRASQQQSVTRLLDRLQARLGPGQVHRLQSQGDHRPERATARQQLAGEPSVVLDALPTLDINPGLASSARLTRPVWLFDPPQPLRPPRSAASAGAAWLDGQPLQLLAGPERIESGWWDGHPAVRDYFIAQTGEGALVWIYRSRLAEPDAAQEGWFLQGRFA